MPNFSLLSSAFRSSDPRPVQLNNQGVLAQAQFEQSKLGAALQLAGPSALDIGANSGGGGGGGPKTLPGISQQAIDKERRARANLLNQQARLTKASISGKVQEYGDALKQVNPQQSKEYTRYIQKLATGYAKNPAVKSVLGGK